MALIQHVTREVRPDELEQCIAFYRLLGFVPVPTPRSLAGRAWWLQGERTQIHLMPKEDSSPQRGHVGVVAEKYELTLGRLREAGHEVEPRREHWGSPRCYVRDPARNLVELMAWGPEDAPENATT